MYNVRDLRHLLRCFTESDAYQYGSSVRPKQIARGPGTSNSVITNIDYFTRHPADVTGVGRGVDTGYVATPPITHYCLL